jgi:hypothetical protein
VEQTAADLAFLDHVGLALAHADAVVDATSRATDLVMTSTACFLPT